MISTADPGIEHLPPPAEVPGSCPQRRRGAPARARRLFPLGPVNPCRDLQSRGSRARRVDRPAGCYGRRGRPRGFPGSLRASPVLLGALPQGRDRRLAKDFAMMTMALPI